MAVQNLDLNAVKIYSGNSLTWQPLLRIPYVTAKSGAFVADAKYKDRTDDYFKATGRDVFILIDEENETFALPNQDIYGIMNTLEADKVNRSGDVMTGTLHWKNKNIVKTTTPKSSLYITNEFRDANDERLGCIEYAHVKDGSHAVAINDRIAKDDGTYTYASLRAGFDTSGNPATWGVTPASKVDNSTQLATTAWVTNHRCTTAAGTTSTASINAPCYVIENYVNGTSWYRKWSDGWIEQGLYATITCDGSSSFSFPIAFSNTNYIMMFVQQATTAEFNNSYAGSLWVYSKTASTAILCNDLWSGYTLIYMCGY